MKSGECESHTTDGSFKGLYLLSRLFRSKSADSKHSKKKVLKPANSSPDATPRRRFVRVVRDNQHVGEEYQNPHVIRRYTKGFWEENNIRKASSLEDTSRPLPYTVSGHTILKKHSFPETDCLAHKRATFKNEVLVIEFSKLEKTANCKQKTRSMPLVNFDESNCKSEESVGISDLSIESSVEEYDEGCSACEEHENKDSENELEQLEKGCDREHVEELHDDSAYSESEQSADECESERQFASLVAADEKEMCAKRLKRKLSSSSSASDSARLASES